MKKIEKNKLVKLLGIIPESPALRLAHFSDSGEEMIEIISDFCKTKEYEYQIN